ncbi:MAG: transporter related [Hyphomicrobiales bacterium]|jgi:branched-chain amino acid transport system ATP-binding protein|nr:transporter related [Hyphomicrobiales bacterium]
MTVAADTAHLIAVRDLAARYGHIEALRPTNLYVAPGEFVTILGPNGAGKTTLLRAMTRLIASTGQVAFKGQDVTSLKTHQLADLGIIMVQEGRGLFGDMSVRENLQIGAYKLAGSQAGQDRQLEKVFSLFPRLKERISQTASSMSGGEQQMLAVGRALMADPKLLILDEPSLGLAPRVATEILSTLGALNKEGLGILLVEQKAPLALKLAQRVYILSSGSVRAELPTHEIKSHHDLARYYFS